MKAVRVWLYLELIQIKSDVIHHVADWQGCKEEHPQRKLAQVQHGPTYVTLFVNGPL